MAGILDFNQYIGGPDQIKAEQVFPSDQKTLIYTFSTPVTGWTFSADYQTIVVDTVTFNRYTGAPNFNGSTVTGTFAKVDIAGANAPAIIDGPGGVVKVILPASMYTGPIIPDARKNVPITVFALTWADTSTPAQINTHRWALIQCWEPDVVAGDPTLDAGYTVIVTGA
jgi:hypothetical protein